MNKELEKCDLDDIKIEEAFKELKTKRAIYNAQRDSVVEQKRQISNSEEYQSLISLRNELDGLQDELNAAGEKKKAFNKAILSEVNDVANYIGTDINLGKYIKTEDYPAFRADLGKYEIFIKEKTNEVIRISVEIDNRRKELTELQKALEEKKNNLEKGVFQYSSEITNLIELIKEETFKKFNKEILVTPLCEMLEIKPGCEKHRNAIEGYLANHRFDLFVPEQYFDFALSLYAKNKERLNIHSVGLVNSIAIPSVNVHEKSLALMLETKDSKAQKYINYLLGNVIFTGKDYYVKDVEKSVDESVFVYSDYSYRQRRPKLFEEPFIGMDSIKMQLQTVKQQLDDIQRENNELSERETKNNVIKNKLLKTKYHSLIESGNVWELFSSAQTRFDLKKQEYDAVDTNQGLTHDLSVLDEQFDKVKEKLEECDEQNNKLVRESTNVETRRKLAKERIGTLETLLDDYRKNNLKKATVDKYVLEHPMTASDVDKAFSDNSKEIERKKTALITKMGVYIKEFNFDAVADIDSLPIFFNEMNTIVTRNLVTYEGKLEDAQKQATLIFQNSYIEEIRDNIKREEENIKLLNKVLKERPFGSDDEVYQFVISKSKDDRFGQYYDIFTSNQNFTSTNLFTETLSDKNASLMQELFERLTSDSKDANQEKLVREYTDYRRFMSYDIRITNKNGKDSYFSKIYKEKSGGETQTPFYVVIAASFDQIVKGGYKTRSPGCLVMFDEAFNNMDESRIESMMQYFNQLSIQPIIAVPTARAKSIFPYVGTSVVLVKSNGRIVNIGWKNDRLSEENN